jgi:hypothetical protein
MNIYSCIVNKSSKKYSYIKNICCIHVARTLCFTIPLLKHKQSFVLNIVVYSSRNNIVTRYHARLIMLDNDHQNIQGKFIYVPKKMESFQGEGQVKKILDVSRFRKTHFYDLK